MSPTTPPGKRNKLIPTLLALVSIACAPSSAAEPVIDGRWTAEARLGGESMRLTLDIVVRGERIDARVSVPAERVLGLSLESVSLTDSALAFRIPNPDHPMDFSGTVGADSIDGSLSMMGNRLPLSFRRAGSIPEVSYRELPVSFEGAGRTVHGSLLLPPGEGPHPAIALFHATSTATRDGPRFYADLAARAGVAALIYDRRDVPIDISRLERADFLGVVADAEAAVKHLRGRTDIDQGRVGVGGLSQGAWLAAIVSERVPKIAFVVGLSCPGVPLHEIDVYQSMQRLERAGVDPATRSNARTLLGDLHAASRGEFDDVQGLRSRLEQTRAQSWARTLDLPETVPAPGSDRLRWAAVDFDPVRFFERLRVPVWLAFGERDERLPSAECAARLRAALERAGNSTVTLRMYPASNHALWPAPELERELSEWLRGRSRR